MSTNLDTTESSSDAVTSTEPPSNPDGAVSGEVKAKVAVGDDLLGSNAGTLTTEPSSCHDGGDTAAHDSVNDARVSGDEGEIVVENVEKVLDEKENEKEVNDEEKEGEYKVSDLVWAKVRNYPWWPGQIFDSSSSTDEARKYSNKKGILIAYFGDQSFAWNEKSKIKPFRKNFFKMEKQSTSTKFLHAVDCALDEALRRIEFGLSCSCLSKEVYDKIKSQTFVNAGIKKEDRRVDGGDNFSTVSTFKPANVVQSVQDLAREHFDGFNRLQVLSLNTQLLAYYRWKGYHQFSTRYFLDGLDNKLEDKSEIAVEKEEDKSEIPLTSRPDSSDEKVSSKKRKLKDKKMVKDAKPSSSDEKVSSKKKKFKDKKMINDAKPASVTVSEKVSKKRKSNGSESVNSKKHKHVLNGDTDTIPKKKEDFSIEDNGKSRNGITDKKPSIPTPKRLFGVGDSICRIAKKLSVSPLIPKKESESQFQVSKESNSVDENRIDSSTKSDESKSTKSETKSETLIPKKESESQFQVSKESNSVDENRIDSSTKSDESKSTKSETKSETLIPKKESESQFQVSKESNSVDENRIDSSTKSDESKSTKSETKSETSDSSLKTSKEKLTALILKFTNLDSIPSVMELNEIFRQYGSLMESETEVLKKSNCAKVVFEEKSNAETAFSSAGKFGIFGPSLISYRLDYSPTPRKIYTRKGKKKNGGD